MEFLKDILIEILRREACRMGTPRIAAHVHMTCVAVLEQIRLIVSNRNVPDFPCIEEILLILEILGRGGDPPQFWIYTGKSELSIHSLDFRNGLAYTITGRTDFRSFLRPRPCPAGPGILHAASFRKGLTI